MALNTKNTYLLYSMPLWPESLDWTTDVMLHVATAESGLKAYLLSPSLLSIKLSLFTAKCKKKRINILSKYNLSVGLFSWMLGAFLGHEAPLGRHFLKICFTFFMTFEQWHIIPGQRSNNFFWPEEKHCLNKMLKKDSK